jgi:arylsulfatase A
MKKACCIAVCGLMATATLARAAAPRPNIVLCFIDDMGYGDIEPYGSRKNRTPRLSRMAAEGVRFTDFYLASTACSPSRSALLTGCYAERVNMHGRVCFPNQPKALNPVEYTMGEMLRDAGYVTGCFGKWHLGHLPGYLPATHGFDSYLGIPYSNDMWPGPTKGNKRYPPLPLIVGEKPVALVRDGRDQSLLCKVFTDAAVDFIKGNKDKLFFCYIPHAFVHLPRFGREGFLQKAGGDATRAQIEDVDWSVGEVIRALKGLGLDERTLVLFMSDNGGARGTSMGPLRGGKGGPKYEGHQRTPFIARWPGRIPAGRTSREIGVTTDLYPTLAKLAGGRLPEHTIDGKDISELLFNPDNAKSPHKVVNYSGGALRIGKWKLVRAGRRCELYDLDTDLGERKDLAKERPDQVKKMEAIITQWRAEIAWAARPNAQMNPAGPLVPKGDTALPTVSEWIGK